MSNTNPVNRVCLDINDPTRKQVPNNMKLSAIKCSIGDITVNDCPVGFKNLNTDKNTFIRQNNSGGPCLGDTIFANTDRYQGLCYRTEYPTDKDSITACCLANKPDTECDPLYCNESEACKTYLANNFDRINTIPLNSNQINPNQINSNQMNPNQINANQMNPNQINSNQMIYNQINSQQIPITRQCLDLNNQQRKQNPANMKLSAIKCFENDVTVADCPVGFKNLDTDVNTYYKQDTFGGPCFGDTPFANKWRYQGKCYRTEYPNDVESIKACCLGNKSEIECDPLYCTNSQYCNAYLQSESNQINSKLVDTNQNIAMIPNIQVNAQYPNNQINSNLVDTNQNVAMIPNIRVNAQNPNNQAISQICYPLNTSNAPNTMNTMNTPYTMNTMNTPNTMNTMNTMNTFNPQYGRISVPINTNQFSNTIENFSSANTGISEETKNIISFIICVLIVFIVIGFIVHSMHKY